MAESLTHRGPDGEGYWADGAVAFGHRMLWTTPESLHERLPMADAISGLAITCDARVDNRGDLIGALGLRRGSEAITDSELILAAYDKWGEDCPTHIAGDFVFAIYDRRRHMLFCARDPMGIKSLYYFESRDLFAFASEIKALLVLSEVPRRLNEVRVLDYLVNIFDDRNITFYEDVRRLPAATAMVISREGIRSSKYWHLDPKREMKLGSDAEYAEAFKECFFESVRCRLRSAYPVSSAVSGGLDSSSIACTADALRRASGASEPIDTFSLVFPGLPKQDLRRIDERPQIDAVLKAGNFRPHFVRADSLSPLNEVAKIHTHLDEAFFAGNLYLHWAMYGEAQRNGDRVFLDGLDGDTTISHGFEYLADLVVKFRWAALYREIGLIRRNLHIGRKRIIGRFCISPLCPTWVYKLRRALHGQFDDLRITSALVRKEFKERLRLAERTDSLMQSGRSCFRTAREKHWEMINSPLYAHALELADKASAAFHVEARYPFFDQRLIELCLSLPANQKLGQGWSRYILRRAMDGILPQEIQWRPAKGDLSPNFYRKLLETDRELVESVILNPASVLSPYIDYTAMRRAYERYRSDPMHSHTESSQVFAAVNLALWLEKAGLARDEGRRESRSYEAAAAMRPAAGSAA